MCDIWWYHGPVGAPLCSLHWQLCFRTQRSCIYWVNYLNNLFSVLQVLFIYLFILTRHCKIEWWTCRYFLNAGYSVIFLYRRFAFLLSSFVPCSKQFPLSFFIIKWKQYDFICRGSCQPYCSSLPDDPLLECFDISDGSNIQGLDVEYRMHI